MNILRNKHLIAAMFITPVLAIAGYYIADRSVAEPPTAIESGRSYPLVARSNCRYQSGMCTLVNGEVELTVRAQRLSENRIKLLMDTDQPVEQALIASTEAGEAENPAEMVRDGNAWQNELTIANPNATQLRMAFTLRGAHFFVETSAVFVDYKTGFPQDNFPDET